MKKVFIIILIFACGSAGYLSYDWYVKTKKQDLEPSITLYSWTDEKGRKHFSDTAPPQGARNITKTEGYKYVDPPLVTTLKDKTIEIYRRLSVRVTNLFKSKTKRKK